MLRATFAGFSVARGALTASQKALDVTGQNISNVYTEGYTRQRLDQVSMSMGYGNYSYSNYNAQVGNGVLITGISQIRDPYLDIQYRNQMANVGESDAKNSILEQVEGVFDETMKSAIKDAFSDLESKLLDLANSTGSELDDSIVRASMQSLVNIFHFNATSLADKRQQITDDFLKNSIRQVNGMLKDIAELNKSIKNSQVLGYPALELQDQRNSLLDELASYIPIERLASDEWLSSTEKVDNISINLILTREVPLTEVRTKYEKNGDDYVLDGNKLKPIQAKNPDGSLKFDDQNNPVYETEEVQVMEKVYETDANGDLKLDNNGNPIPVYLKDANGNTVVDEKGNPVQETTNNPVMHLATQRVTLIDNEKYGSFSYDNTNDKFTEVTVDSLQYDADGKVITGTDGSPVFDRQILTDSNTQSIDINGGTFKGTLDMLNSSGVFDGDATKVRGLGYYEQAFDLLVHTFATAMNKLNEKDPNGGDGGLLFTTSDGSNQFTAANIKVNEEWIRGNVKLKTKQDPNSGSTQNDNINKFIESLNKSTEFKVGSNTIYEGNFYNYYVNAIESTLGIDQQSTKNLLDTHITVINTIAQSKDQTSGVSLDEEGVNLMQYQQSFTAASRLMTSLDEVLDKLINSTGVCGR